jgi:hypothetical protein
MNNQAPKLKLIDQARQILRRKHYAYSTERSYIDWIRRFIQSGEESIPLQARQRASLIGDELGD